MLNLRTAPQAATTAAITPLRALTLHDRCDRCDQHAVAIVMVDTTELLFCGHHIRKNFSWVIASGYRHSIPSNERPFDIQDLDAKRTEVVDTLNSAITELA